MVDRDSGEAMWDAEKRDFAADERDKIAAERDAIADVRDEIADERDRAADEREDELDAREQRLDERAQALGVPVEHDEDETLLARMRRIRSKTLREAAHQQREDRSRERQAGDAARENLKEGRSRRATK